MAPFGNPYPLGYASPYLGSPIHHGSPAAMSPYHYPPHHPYFGGHGYGYGYGGASPYYPGHVASNSYHEFLEFIDQRDKMKEHLDKQTESLNSLKNELEGLKKNEYEFGEKVRHGHKQIIPITRSKR